MAEKKQPPRKLRKGELSYFITLFKIEGHTTYRAHMSGKEDSFEAERKTWTNPPKVTEKRVIKIDRVTGELEVKEI